MNNQIFVNETDLAVSAFLKSINVSFKAVNVGMRKDKDWVADAFRVTFSRSNRKDNISSDYSLGLGHRIVRKHGVTPQDSKILTSDDRRVTLIDKSDWSNDDRKTLNKLSAAGYGKVFAVTPGAAAVLYSLLSDADCGSETHADFCANLGYDEDSRKGLEIYLACQKIADEIRKFFTGEELEALREMLEDY